MRFEAEGSSGASLSYAAAASRAKQAATAHSRSARSVSESTNDTSGSQALSAKSDSAAANRRETWRLDVKMASSVGLAGANPVAPNARTKRRAAALAAGGRWPSPGRSAA